MKRIKRMLLLLVMVIAGAFVLTACGKVEEPTVADVEEALRDEGYIKDGKKSSKDDDDDKKSKDDDDDKKSDDDDDDKKSDDEDKDDEKDKDKDESKSKAAYEVKIDKCKISDEKDKATVTATLIENKGSVTITSEFKIVFKYNKDKKSWKSKSVDREEGPNVELTAGIDDATAEQLVKSRSYSNDDIYVYSDEIVEAKATGESNLDKEDNKDKRTVHVKAENKRSIYEFDVEAVFNYTYYDGDDEGTWYLYETDVKNFKSEVSDNFKLKITDSDLKKNIKDSSKSIYLWGDSYKTDEDVVEIENLKYDDPDLSDVSYYVNIPVEFDVVIGKKVSIHYSAEASYSFDDAWKFGYMTSWTEGEIKSDIEETWVGVMNQKDDYAGDKVVLNITKDFDDDGYQIAKVKVTPSDTEKPAYSFHGRMTTLSLRDGEKTYKMAFVDWDGEKPSGVYSTSFYGVVDGNTWTPTSSYDKWTLKLSDGTEPVEPDPTPTPTPDPDSGEGGNATAATEAKGGDINGTWDIGVESQGIRVGIQFTQEGKANIVEDMSGLMHFNSDGSLYVKSAGMSIPKDYTTIDASGLKVSIEGQDMLVFKRLDSNSGVDGSYSIAGGALLDGLTSSVAGGTLTADNFLVEIKGEKMFMYITGLITYSTEGTKLSLSGDAAAFGLDSMNGDIQYTVENDVLTIFEADGDVTACKRFKF